MDSLALVAPRIYLIVRTGDDAKVVDIEENAALTIGTSDEASIVVRSDRCAPMHARAVREATGLFVEDLGSPFGTRINREREKLRGARRRVGGGDVIRIGRAEIVVVDTIAHSDSSQGSGSGLSHVAAPVWSEQPVIADPATLRLFELASRVAMAPIAVLVTGETGTGKELLAEHIHRSSLRAHGPFVRLNCGALPEALLESELFGYDRGAFTGADRRKVGLLEAGHRGTLFLDEVGELQPPIQAKLLRAIESGRFIRLGGTSEVGVDIRIISATHRNLEADAAAGRFRHDLYFRLAAFVLRLPPLRERPSEIAPLAELFAHRFAQRLGTPAPSFAPDAMALLRRHPWPGNVRELRNAVEHASVVAGGGEIGVVHLPEHVRGRASGIVRVGPIREQIETMERKAIEDALHEEGGNQTRAAERLGLSRRALVYKLAKYRHTR